MRAAGHADVLVRTSNAREQSRCGCPVNAYQLLMLSSTISNTAARISPAPRYPTREKASPHHKKATTAATTGSRVAVMEAPGGLQILQAVVIAKIGTVGAKEGNAGQCPPGHRGFMDELDPGKQGQGAHGGACIKRGWANCSGWKIVFRKDSTWNSINPRSGLRRWRRGVMA